jgi:putative membrane protein
MLNDELANDRTFLAWLRTGVAVIALGFVVAKIALIVKPHTSDEAFYTTAGVVLVFSGAALIVVGYAQHKRVASGLPREDDVRTQPGWPAAITAAALAAALMLAALIVVTT